MTLGDLSKYIALVIAFHVVCFLIGYSLGFYPH